MSNTNKAIADLLRSCLANDMDAQARLNSGLSRSDIADTIQTAIQLIEDLPPSEFVKVSRRVAWGFASGTQELFVDDANWSFFDLPYAKEFCETVEFRPNKKALETDR